MIGALMGLPGKLKTLSDRLSATWSAKLDTLATDYTTARAAKLDNLSVNVNTLATASNLALVAKETSPILASTIASGGVGGSLFGYQSNGSILGTFGGFATHETTSTTYANAVSYTGAGVLSFALVENKTGHQATIEVIIDGLSMGEFSPSAATVNTHAVAVGGTCVSGYQSVTPYYAYVPILDFVPFKTSLVIRHKTTSGGTSKAIFKYRKTA